MRVQLIQWLTVQSVITTTVTMRHISIFVSATWLAFAWCAISPAGETVDCCPKREASTHCRSSPRRFAAWVTLREYPMHSIEVSSLPRRASLNLKGWGSKRLLTRSFHDDSALLQGVACSTFACISRHGIRKTRMSLSFCGLSQTRITSRYSSIGQGSDRTGYVVAAYRMVEQSWSAEDAIAEMRHFGFHPIWIGIPEAHQAVRYCSDTREVGNATIVGRADDALESN